jgi:GGDEF domain-containing protein
MLSPELRVQLLFVAVLLLLVAVVMLRRVVLRRMADRAIRDPQTGVYTADFIQEVYQAELRRAERTGVPFSIALVSLRDEGASSRPLPLDASVAAAQWLRQTMRGSDYIGRLDEHRFAMVLPETWEEDARLVLARIDGSFRYQPKSNGEERWLTCTVGVATWTPENPDAWVGAVKQLEDALGAPKRQSSGSLSANQT